MDIHGLAKILLTCISSTSELLLKRYDTSSTEIKKKPEQKEPGKKEIMCDACGKMKATLGMNNVLGGICICANCTQKILAFYVSNSPLKTLCPFCFGEGIDVESCEYCDLPSPIDQFTISED